MPSFGEGSNPFWTLPEGSFIVLGRAVRLEASVKHIYSKKICWLRLCTVVLIMSEPIHLIFIGFSHFVLVMQEI